jgi:hypothetical protein
MHVVGITALSFVARSAGGVSVGIAAAKLIKLHGLTESEADRLVVELTSNAMWREPKPAPPAPDPGDDHLWALLDSYLGSVFITGDYLLLENPPVKSSVVSPKTYVDSLLGLDDSTR